MAPIGAWGVNKGRMAPDITCMGEVIPPSCWGATSAFVGSFTKCTNLVSADSAQSVFKATQNAPSCGQKLLNLP